MPFTTAGGSASPATTSPVVGLLINEAKPAAVAAAETLTRALAERGVAAVRLSPTLAERLPERAGERRQPATEREIAASDFVVVLGGDGTLLGAARLLAPYGTPMLGVHLGSFGFITEAHPDGLIPGVEKVLAGDCRIDERLMLAGEVFRNGDGGDGGNGGGPAPTETLLGLNDVVVASGAVRMVHVRTRIGDDDLATYAADGVIVASPTGSTGYSLSAGGPLVHPSAPVLLITPICPHTLNARTLLVPGTETVRLTVEGSVRDVVVATVDGQIEIALHPGDTVRIRRSPHTVRLLSVGGPNFYHKIRSRWHYGER